MLWPFSVVSSAAAAGIVPGRLTTFTLFGGGTLDLRYADFTSSDVEIHAYSILGGQTILLPPEVNVEIQGHGVMGGFNHQVEGSGVPGAPKVTMAILTVGGSASSGASARLTIPTEPNSWGKPGKPRPGKYIVPARRGRGTMYFVPT